jgi:Cys-tRNA(Pro)/Cys-tRNA(Cys) deacylase
LPETSKVPSFDERYGDDVTPAIVLLEKRKIPHEILSYDHDPAIESYGTEAAEALDLDPTVVFKTLLVDVDALGLAVAVLPVGQKLDLKAMAKALGAKRVRMADADDASRITGYVVGGISPLAQKKRLPTVIDASAVTLDSMHVSAGRRGLEVRLAPSDLATLTNATAAPIAK